MINVVFLCLLNIIFMVVGIFLNSVVILSLWRSRHLRKQLCYFMILVLSCFDLAVVAVTHPFFIASTIYYSLDEINEICEDTRRFIAFVFQSSSMFALFTLNMERFVALTRPFLHQALVTKTRLKYFQAILTVIVVSLSPLIYLDMRTIVRILVAVFLSLLLLLFIYSNYKIFTIAKSKRIGRAEQVNYGRNQILNLKKVSTCSLAVGCFFICSFPQIIYSSSRLATGAPNDRQVILFSLWVNTLTSINSTLNCVIFFWRNSTLRREGMKIVNFI